MGSSETVTITVVGTDGKLTASGHLCATTSTIHMQASSSNMVTYQWYRNNQLMSGQTADSLQTSQDGQYWAVLAQQPLDCVSLANTLSIVRSTAVQATIQSATGSHRLCPQDSLRLTGSGGVQYTWQKDGQLINGIAGPQYQVRVAGTYSLTAIDADGCMGVSAPFSIEQIPPVTVTLDSVPAICGVNVPVITLNGSPPGSEYAGAGIAEAEFSPLRAGVGNHALTYTVKAAPECAGTVVT